MEITLTEKEHRILTHLITRKIESYNLIVPNETTMQEVRDFTGILSKLKDKEGLDDSVIL